MRKWLNRKVLDHLKHLKENEAEKYLTFWQQFGPILKEGVGTDYENKDRLLNLMLFRSSHDPEKHTSLAEYKSRMKEGQEEIYYITGESRSKVEGSPHLEAFRARGYEVLYLLDPVDEMFSQSLSE